MSGSTDLTHANSSHLLLELLLKLLPSQEGLSTMLFMSPGLDSHLQRVPSQGEGFYAILFLSSHMQLPVAGTILGKGGG